MFPNLTTDEVMDLAVKVGARVSRDFPGTEADDITAAALADLADKAESLKTDDAGYIYKVLEQDAVRYASKERYDYMLMTAQYVYRPAEVRALLKEAYFDPTMWDTPSAKEDRLSAMISGSVVVTSLLDLRDALERLPKRHRDDIVSYFRDGEDPPNRMRITRAVDSLTRFMNRAINKSTDHEGPGARRAYTSAETQAAVARQVDAESDPYGRDAVDQVQAMRSYEPADPAGTHFNWAKYGS